MSRVTVDDYRAAGLCSSGVRRACTTFGIDFRRLVREGIPIVEIEHIDDANLQNVITKAKERTNGQ